MARRTTSRVDDFVIDFSKEEQGGGGGIRIKPGRYRVRVIAAKAGISTEKKTPLVELTLLILEGKYKGKKLTERVYATPKTYGRFRTLLEAIGKKVPKTPKLGAIAAVVKGEELWVEVDDEHNEGYKTRSRVTFDGFLSDEDVEDDDLDEEDEDEDDDFEDEEDDDEDDDEDEDDEDDEDEDDDEDEPEPPKRRSRSRTSTKSKPAARSSRRRKSRKDEDEDDDLDLDEF